MIPCNAPAVCRGVHIRPILDLDCLRRTLHQPPELTFHVVFTYSHISQAIDCGVIWLEHVRLVVRRWMGFEPQLAELKITCLEARKTMLLALIEAEVIAGSEEACMAEPLALRDSGQWGVETEHVET